MLAVVVIASFIMIVPHTYSSSLDLNMIGIDMRSTMDMDTTIKGLPIGQNEIEKIVNEILAVPIEDMSAPPKTIIGQPELQLYLTDFRKKKDDLGLVAEVDTKEVGAVWVRIMSDYGHINDSTPSFAISLYKKYRGFGIGTALMKEMLCILKQRGYKQTSLAVQKANYAVKMYMKVGFKIVDEIEKNI